MSSTPRQRGFTLVEVLVATVVVAIGLLGVLTAFSMASRVTAVAQNDTVLSFLAQQRLAEIQLLGREYLPIGTAEGDFSPEFPDYLWRLTVHSPSVLNVQRVDLVISAPEAGRRRETQFSTAIF